MKKNCLHSFLQYILVLILPFSILSASQSSKHYLKSRIPKKNFRYETFKEALDLCSKRDVHSIVETGTSRGGDSNFLGDGGSTIIFADWALNNNATFYSVDIDEEALAAANKALPVTSNSIQLVCRDSVEFLETFGEPIDFLYLDSYDFELDNPMPSQIHHLKEVEAAEKWLHEDSIIMIDDCDLPHGGKGRLVIRYLLERGWRIHKKSYQIILLRN